MENEKREEKRRHEAYIERLVKKGKATRRGTGRVPDEFFELPMPEDPEGSLLRTLLEDRREGR